MRRFGWISCVALAGGVLPAGAAFAQTPPQDSAVYGISGAYTYRTHCASCHGGDGKGEGPLADSLRYRPPDLTLLSRRNGGEYPADTIQRIVDGRKPLKGHGGPDMPIWGDAFKNADTGYDDERVKEKIRSVVHHLRTLQSK